MPAVEPVDGRHHPVFPCSGAWSGLRRSLDGKLYAFKAADGTPLWNYPTGSYIGSSPAVAHGVVYVVSEDGKLYAFGIHQRQSGQ